MEGVAQKEIYWLYLMLNLLYRYMRPGNVYSFVSPRVEYMLYSNEF